MNPRFKAAADIDSQIARLNAGIGNNVIAFPALRANFGAAAVSFAQPVEFKFAEHNHN